MHVSNRIDYHYIIYTKDFKLKLQELEMIVNRRLRQDLKIIISSKKRTKTGVIKIK